MSKRNVAFFLIMIWCMLLGLGCSTDATSDDTGDGDDNTTTTTADVASIAIGVSSSYVLTDNSDSITVSVSVLDEDYAAVSDATVTFSSTGGLLSAATATTDESGIAEVSFSAGYNDKSNRQVVITAQSNGLTAQVPVSITGTTVEAEAVSTSLVTGGASDTLTITVTDAGGAAIYNADVSLSVSASSTGNVSLEPASGQTDTSGQLEVEVAGTSAGTTTISISAGGAIASQTYSVQASSSALSILTPSDPASMSTSDSITITVSDPNPGDSNQVVIATSVGTLNGSGSSVTLPVSDGQVQATLTSSVAGTATITAYDSDSPSITDTLTVAIYAPVSEAAKLSLQASNSVVATSTATLTNTVELTATLLSSTDAGVGEAPILFTMTNQTSGGESIAPVIVYTDASGEAISTFYSGSKSSGGEGVTVTATLMDTAITSSTAIVIGGTAGSVVMGSALSVESSYDDTMYELSISVLVSDSNGNPVPNADVSLGVWPTYYLSGDAFPDGEYDPAGYTGQWPNEDADRNLFLDTGEDNNGDGEITPPNSAAGNVPASLTTDEKGAGTFELVYLKQHAAYIVAEITASTYVLGSETRSTYTFVLPWAESDTQYLGASPFLAP